jgi:hypothetical protein
VFPGSIRPETMLAVERLGARVRIGDPQTCVIVTDHRRKQAPASSGAVIGGQHIENVELHWPLSIGVLCWSCHRDPDWLTASLSDGHAVRGVTLVTQGGGPESLTPVREARAIKDLVCHYSAVGLLP